MLGLKNKKADATDTILILVIVFFLAISFVVVLFVNDKFIEIISTTALNESAAAPAILDGLTRMSTVTIQRGFVLFFTFLVIGIIASSFLVRVHPVFIFIYIITLSVAIFTAVFLSNAYQLVVDNPAFSTVATNATMITYIMQNLVRIILGVGAFSMVVVFAKVVGKDSMSVSDI